MVNSKLKPLLLCLLIVFGVTFAFPAFAFTPDDISAALNPTSPAPGDNVSIMLSSYAANLDTVSISWLVNGKSVTSGIGQKSFSTTAGAAGSRTIVTAKILFVDGEVDKQIIINPEMMVMLWQPTNSYVPPFYKGKTLLTEESEVKVVAIPEIKVGNTVTDPKNMTYTWQKNYENQGDAGGYGKNFFTFTTDYLNDTNSVEVTASTVDQNYSSQGDITLGTTAPEISLYKVDPTLGTVWEQALPESYTAQSDETVLAAPYFMSPKNLMIPSLAFSWFINDVAVKISSTGIQKNVLPVKVPAGTSGASSLRVEVSNTSTLTQTASKEISIQF